MKNTKNLIAAALIMLITAAAPAAAAKQSAVVGEYPQKIAHKYPLAGKAESPQITAFAMCGEVLYAGTSEGLVQFAGGEWAAVATKPPLGGVTQLECADGGLAVSTGGGLFRVDPQSGETGHVFERGVTAFARWNGGYAAGTTDGLFIIENGAAEKIDALGAREVTAIEADENETLWIGFNNGLASYSAGGSALYRSAVPGESLIDNNVRDLLAAADGYLYIATPEGISRFDRESEWKDITGKQGGLPYEDVLCLAGGGDALWAGTAIGAARYKDGEWQYMQSREYLPDDRVDAALAMPDGGAWLGTPAGASRIEYRMMTLEDKAAIIEEKTRRRHVRLGLVSDSSLEVAGDLDTNQLRTSDNDGLWTAMYIAAECYRYGATGDPEAKKFARQSLEALMFLETVNEIPGFISRSFAEPDFPHGGGEWHHITSDGKWRWKGDTSSDEMDGHFYAYSVYYDVCATEEEKEEIREKVRLIAGYLIDNDYFLIDADGEPTTWGRWNPHFLNTEFRFQRNLNALEILMVMKTAHHITGEERFKRAYFDLAKNHNYAKYMVKQKINQPGIINHSDDELAFLAYYPLLKYEKHPVLQKMYRESIVRSWEIEQPERNPLFNFIYGAVMPEGTDFDLDGSLYTLRRISLDLVWWGHLNSHRADIETKGEGRHGENQSVTPLPPDERQVMKWNGNPYKLDSSRSGHREEAGTFWLLPYWMGRYYGFIVEEDAD